MDIEPGSGSVSIAFNQPSEAGLPLITASASDNSKWINYTSCNTASVTRKIMVQITSGNVPSGTALDLSVSSYQGNGAGGNFGTPNSTIQLSNTAQGLLTGIASCFTGDGVNNGHCLTYSLRIVDYTNVKTLLSSTVIVNFTMMDH